MKHCIKLPDKISQNAIKVAYPWLWLLFIINRIASSSSSALCETINPIDVLTGKQEFFSG